jgi:flavin-dependent dehydrogenase
MLIGDAAGLAYAQSGEGIRPAVESALMAARVILKCQGDYGVDRLQPFVNELENRFGKRHSQPLPPAGTSSEFRQFLARILMKNHWFSKNILIRRWFLHATDQPLPATITYLP